MVTERLTSQVSYLELTFLLNGSVKWALTEATQIVSVSACECLRESGADLLTLSE